MEAYCKGGQGPRRAVEPSKKKKKKKKDDPDIEDTDIISPQNTVNHTSDLLNNQLATATHKEAFAWFFPPTLLILLHSKLTEIVEQINVSKYFFLVFRYNKIFIEKTKMIENEKPRNTVQ